MEYLTPTTDPCRRNEKDAARKDTVSTAQRNHEINDEAYIEFVFASYGHPAQKGGNSIITKESMNHSVYTRILQRKGPYPQDEVQSHRMQINKEEMSKHAFKQDTIKGDVYFTNSMRLKLSEVAAQDEMVTLDVMMGKQRVREIWIRVQSPRWMNESIGPI